MSCPKGGGGGGGFAQCGMTHIFKQSRVGKPGNMPSVSNIPFMAGGSAILPQCEVQHPLVVDTTHYKSR